MYYHSKNCLIKTKLKQKTTQEHFKTDEQVGMYAFHVKYMHV